MKKASVTVISFGVLLLASGILRSQIYPAGLKACAPAPSLLCGTFRVFEDREKKSGRTIDLNIVVLPSVGERKYAPMFDLQGGPGVAATNDVQLFLKEVPQYRTGRDIVLVDQRGTGRSNPLRCALLPDHTALDEMYPLGYVRDCRQALDQRADLTKYTTEIAMDDLDDIRRWLGYHKIDLWALSYGTRAAQVYVRQHGANVGHVVLTGAIGTYHKMPFYHASNAQASLDILLAECTRDTQCHTAFPSIERETHELFERLNSTPAKVSYSDPTTGSSTTYVIRGDIMAEQIRKWLYTRETTQQIPFESHRAAAGDYVPFLNRVLRIDGQDSTAFIADGMYLSVTCAEDVPFIDVAAAHAVNKATIFGDYRVLQQKRACKKWRRGKVGSSYRTPVVSDVPVMFVTGAMDPVTAPRWADELAKGFRNHVMITVAEQGHGPIGLSKIACEDNLMIRFMSDLPITDADKACLATMRPSPFVMSDIRQ
ncbi:MAG: alpha/beta fold hydrolase [Pyrinomonadaceae bacterium]